MIIATFFFSLMGSFVKLGSTHFSSVELVFYRSFISLVFLFLYIVISHKEIKTPHLRKQIDRGVVGFLSLAFFFYAIAHLNLGSAMTLNYTSPIFLGFFLPFISHQKIKKSIFICTIVGFTGALLILDPHGEWQSWFAGLVGLVSGIGAALAYIHVIQLSKLNEPDWRTVFYFTLVSSIGSGLWISFTDYQKLAWNDIWILIPLGLSATIAQIAMTRAYRLGNSIVIGTLSYLAIVFSGIISLLYFNETMRIEDVLGALMIIISGAIASNISLKSRIN
ncbi:DMT family transporter [Candidatus Methylopumilus universalis]|nr:DMT family transporter [Candidatus Methylopumilus universalis]QDC91207.1 DMT family transporter [Candidatus Methylopumilus universalis]